MISKPKNIVPVIGSISTGKSTFYNSLLGIDLLDARDEVTTKFALILRHNPNLKTPIFYHLKLVPGKEGETYEFEKDPNDKEASTREEIKKKIVEFNNKIAAEIDKKQSQMEFSDAFFMLELNIEFVKNEEFLEKYDFVDMPGINEPRVDYVEKFYKYIKNKVKFGILLFSSMDFRAKEGIENIKKVKRKCGFRMKDFLIILNKFDMVEEKDRENVIKDFRAYLTEQMGSKDCEPNPEYKYDIMSDSNSWVPLDSELLKAETLFEKDFSYCLFYYFKLFLDENINSKGTVNSYFEFLKTVTKGFMEKLFSKKKKEEREKYEKFIEEAQNISVSVFEEEMTKNMLKSIQDKIEKKNLKFQIVFENDDEIPEEIDDEYDYVTIVMKILYKLHHDKKIEPTFSKGHNELLKYFDKPKEVSDSNLERSEISSDSDPKKAILDDLSKHCVESYKNFQNLLQNDKEDNEIIKSFTILGNTFNTIRIPMFGIYSSGKSSFLSCIVGKQLLPQDVMECTKKAIVIKHVKFENDEDRKKAVMYSAGFEAIGECDGSMVYKFVEKEKICEGLENIHANITSLNKNATEHENKKDKEQEILGKSFYVIHTNIRFIDEMDVPEEVKNRIELIDLPGLNTYNNLFSQSDIMYNVLSLCNYYFFFIPCDTPVEDNNQQNTIKFILSELKRLSKQNDEEESFLKNCLFIFTKCDAEKEEARNPANFKKRIRTIAKLFLGCRKKIDEKIEDKEIDKLEKNIKACKFSAHQYNFFKEKQKQFSDLKYFIGSFSESYNSQKGNWIRGEKNFLKFIEKSLKGFDEDFEGKLKKDEYKNVKIKEELEKKISNYEKELSNDALNNVAAIYNCANKNIDQLKSLKESHGVEMKQVLSNAFVKCSNENLTNFKGTIIELINKVQNFYDGILKDRQKKNEEKEERKKQSENKLSELRKNKQIIEVLFNKTQVVQKTEQVINFVNSKIDYYIDHADEKIDSQKGNESKLKEALLEINREINGILEKGYEESNAEFKTLLNDIRKYFYVSHETLEKFVIKSGSDPSKLYEELGNVHWFFSFNSSLLKEILPKMKDGFRNVQSESTNIIKVSLDRFKTKVFSEINTQINNEQSLLKSIELLNPGNIQEMIEADKKLMSFKEKLLV